MYRRIHRLGIPREGVVRVSDCQGHQVCQPHISDGSYHHLQSQPACTESQSYSSLLVKMTLTTAEMKQIRERWEYELWKTICS
jgi:hypothetical protein